MGAQGHDRINASNSPVNAIDPWGLERKPGKTPPTRWPRLPDNILKKPKWNPEGYWEGKGGKGKITWDDRSHGAGVDRGDGPQGGHWDDECSDNRWDEDGNLLPGSPDLEFEYPPIPPVPPFIPPITPGGTGGGPTGSTGGCFAAGTLVHTDKGLTPVENIKLGDRVFAKDVDSGASEFKRVVATVIALRRDVVKIFIDEKNAEQILASSNHKFYVKDKGWVVAANLAKGDYLLDKNLKAVKIEKIEKIVLDKEIKVFNIEVEDIHNFFVGNIGILTHNGFPLKSPAPIWDKPGRR